MRPPHVGRAGLGHHKQCVWQPSRAAFPTTHSLASCSAAPLRHQKLGLTGYDPDTVQVAYMYKLKACT